MNFCLNIRDYRRVNWRGKDLRGVDLVSARLYGAQLDGANLDGAWLHVVILDGARLVGACRNSRTVFPEGFDWRAAGVITEED